MREIQVAAEKASRDQRVKNHIFDLVLNLNSLDRNNRSIVLTTNTSAVDIFDK